jgi:hypothetical protein
MTREGAARRSAERSVEALTVAMALAPGVYTRNRMFDFFAQPAVQRARSRASVLRGIVRQLPRARAVTVETEGRTATGERTYVLRYQIPEMHLARVAELTRVELAAMRLLAERAGVAALPPSADDRAIVDAALARLMNTDTESRDLAEAASSSVAPPPLAE